VGIVLINRECKVFVGARLDASLAPEFNLKNGKEAWQMPQGGIDPGEDPAHAALRELKEEIGTNNASILAETKEWHTYDFPLHLQGKLWPNKFTDLKGQRQKWFLMGFEGSDDEINLMTKHPEFHSYRWVTPKEAIDSIVEFKRKLYEDIFSEFAPFFQKNRCL
jgi:putative (di)nucleoside polyphosphate hydrolase